MPRIEIHSEYSALLNNSESEVASYVSEKYQHVQWIMRSLKQRKQTLPQVMTIIMENNVISSERPRVFKTSRFKRGSGRVKCA